MTAKENEQNAEAAGWGSDVISDLLRALELPYAVIVPGASFRGLHDSIVNHLGNVGPSMVLCQHEDHSVAIAHGYGLDAFAAALARRGGEICRHQCARCAVAF